jgi:hypothetical protein
LGASGQTETEPSQRVVTRLVSIGKRATGALLAGVIATSIGACTSGLGGFSGAVGNTPPVPAETSFRVLGTPGTPFAASISDSRSSWVVKGSIPQAVVIVNNSPPVRMVATKLSGDSSLMSINIFNGAKLISLASTSAAFGTVSVQVGMLDAFAPPANPDLRVFVIGPAGELFNGFIEDSSAGFEVQERAPALFLFDSPNGSIDGLFQQRQNLGSFDINMTLNGEVVATITGGPKVSIRQP